MQLNRFRDRLTAMLPGIVVVIFLLQPCLDVLSYWLDVLALSNTLTLLLRLLLLAGMVGLGFLLTDQRAVYYRMALVLGGFTLCHVGFCLMEGYSAPVTDLANLLRIYQLPLTAMVFITFFRRNKRCFSAVGRGFVLCLAAILTVEILSVLTGTEPYTYTNKQIGIRGWFYLPNAQSAILSMVIPMAMAHGMERNNYDWRLTLGITVCGFGMLYCFATRLAYAAMLGTAAAFCGVLVLLKVLYRKPTGAAALVMALSLVLGLVLLPVSPMERNTELVGVNAEAKQADIDELVAADDAAAALDGLTGEERKLASLRSAYEKYLPGVTGRFGLERTAERYGYSTSVKDLSNTRLEKLTYCRMLLEDLPHCRLFGLSLTDMTFAGETYDVENDFHGIYFLCGVAGLSLMVLFLGFFVLRIAAALFRDFRGSITAVNGGCAIALICGIVHAVFTAGVLRRPNTTFYLAVILALVYENTRLPAKKEGTHEN